MAETPHDATASACPCRSCTLTRRRQELELQLEDGRRPAERVTGGAGRPERTGEREPRSPGERQPAKLRGPQVKSGLLPDNAVEVVRINLHTRVPAAAYEAAVRKYSHATTIERRSARRRREAVLDLHRMGVGIRPIAEVTGLDKTTVAAWLAEASEPS